MLSAVLRSLKISHSHCQFIARTQSEEMQLAQKNRDSRWLLLYGKYLQKNLIGGRIQVTTETPKLFWNEAASGIPVSS